MAVLVISNLAFDDRLSLGYNLSPATCRRLCPPAWKRLSGHPKSDEVYPLQIRLGDSSRAADFSDMLKANSRSLPLSDV
jgi:hypothetical protein